MSDAIIDGQEQIINEIEPSEESQISEELQKKKELLAELLEYFAFIQDKENRMYVFWLHLLGFTNSEIAERLDVAPAAITDCINNMISDKYPVSRLLSVKFDKPSYMTDKYLYNKTYYNKKKAA